MPHEGRALCPSSPPDEHAGITVIEMEFDEAPDYLFASYYPQLHGGEDVTGDTRI